jgi:hypothetical protein
VNARDDSGPLLARLLGPAAPEVSCAVCFDQLDRYVELERDGDDADVHLPGMRAHLDGCPACHDDYESLRTL